MKTYLELLEILSAMSPEELKQTITILDSKQDELFGATKIFTTTEAEDRLDNNHLVIQID